MRVDQDLEQVDATARRNAREADELARLAEDMAAQAASLAQIVTYFRVAGTETQSESRSGRTPVPMARSAET